MPQLGESVTEGTIAKWLKREGERIAKYEPLVEVITDKVNSEIPSPEAGVVAHIVVPEGQTVKVGTEIATIEPDGAVVAQSAAATPEPAPQPASAGESATAGAPKYTDEDLRRRSSPLVRRLAKEHGVDLSLVTGTGTGGRVTKEDMLAYIETRQAAKTAPAAATPPPAAEEAPTPSAAVPSVAPLAGAVSDEEEALPLSPARRAIAEHMLRSVTTAPHAWTYVEVDASHLVAARTAARQEFQRREGFDLTYVPFVAHALVEALREHPMLNSTWRDGQVVLKKRVHLGIAVALEDNLVVPVVRSADEKSVVGMARALNDLVSRARDGKLTPNDVQGGTFTLNNTGALGSIVSMPIINQPQAAILTMEAITKRVVVTADDAIAVRPMLNLCISFDHRVCDGLQVLRFMQSLKQRIEAIAPGGVLH